MANDTYNLVFQNLSYCRIHQLRYFNYLFTINTYTNELLSSRFIISRQLFDYWLVNSTKYDSLESYGLRKARPSISIN